MNILYLIGNGFDLAQGLKTSYQDFYNYLKTQEPINSVAELMLEHIKGPDIKLWKDLELKLGEFTKEVSNKALFEDFYYDLCEKLKMYLIKEADSFTPSKEIKEKYARDIAAPYSYLSERDQIVYRDFFNSIGGDRVISVVSFNYTDVFDKAIYANDSKIELPSSSYKYSLNPTINIHGKLNAPYILMGVNDETQIMNPDFAKDEDVWDYLVKPRSNFEIGSLIDERVTQLILSSHLIVTMGLSFGETDLYWWRIIGERLKRNSKIRIIVFSYESSLPSDPRRHQRIRREKQRDFLSKCGIDESEYSTYENNIIVHMNSGMLSRNTHYYKDERKGL